MKFTQEFLRILAEVTSNEVVYTKERKALLDYWRNHLNDYVSLYYLLGDEKSKKTFIDLLRFNMGTALSGRVVHEKYTLFPNKVWKELECKAAGVKKHVPGDYSLDRIETFILEGYNYENICRVEPGDTVFDCGAFTGNTAVYFSECTRGGRVYSFEPMPSIYQQLVRNVNDENVIKEQYAISDRRKTLRFTATANAASRQSSAPDAIEVPAISIDEYVREKKLAKVDFIKMDIEGAELEALQGASETIRRSHPKLAISIYHKNSDYIEIPRQIRAIREDYVFYIKHNSNVFWETVLFAMPVNERQIIKDFDSEYELSSVKLLWSIFDNAFINKQKRFEAENLQRRKLLLNAYTALCLERTFPRDLFARFQEDNYCFAYFPLSKDEKLHYEFWFVGEEIKVCLHMENNWQEYGRIFKEIGKQNVLRSSFFQGYFKFGYEVSYSTKKINDVSFVANLMHYLVEMTLPVLITHGLIDDEILFKCNLISQFNIHTN